MLLRCSCLILLQGTLGGVLAAKSGHDVIMTPTSHCYFDYKQAPRYVAHNSLQPDVQYHSRCNSPGLYDSLVLECVWLH